MAYVDGYVIAVPTDKKDAYRAIAEKCAVVFKEHGALKIAECWGEDVPDGKLTSFPMAVKCQPDETVVFSWVWWPSKAARDAGNKKIYEDPRMQGMEGDMPFDGKRLIMGGFDVLIEA